jgi:hypothetical protein
MTAGQIPEEVNTLHNQTSGNQSSSSYGDNLCHQWKCVQANPLARVDYFVQYLHHYMLRLCTRLQISVPERTSISRTCLSQRCRSSPVQCRTTLRYAQHQVALGDVRRLNRRISSRCNLLSLMQRSLKQSARRVAAMSQLSIIVRNDTRSLSQINWRTNKTLPYEQPRQRWHNHTPTTRTRRQVRAKTTPCQSHTTLVAVTIHSQHPRFPYRQMPRSMSSSTITAMYVALNPV